ncbi:MAG: S8 family serine peptidase [Nitrospirae bacterium]|nr:S8 family serine peptidase [Nitrospirota bacterium]
MKHLGFVLAVIVGLFIWFPSLKGGTISTEVQRQIDSASPSDHLKVIVQILDNSPLTSFSLEGKSKRERHETIARTLKRNADDSQKSLKKTLEGHRKAGKAQNIRPFWIVNAIALEATPEAIRDIVLKHANIDILSDRPVYAMTGGRASTAGTRGWNIDKINAPALWAKGYTGQDVVVATLDTGVDVTHPDLAPTYRGGSDSWHDTFGVYPFPVDSAGPTFTGHGTGVMSLIVGRNASLNSGLGPGGPVGVSPDTQWIAGKIFDDSGAGSTSTILDALDWVADPDRNLNTSDAPEIVNGSFGIDEASCDTTFQTAILHLYSMGMMPVFAAGNGTVPAVPADYVRSIAVGSSNSLDSVISNSNGPPLCSTSPPKLYFPDLVAPGENVWIAIPGIGTYPNSSYYDTGIGTSFAAPHVAGAAALLLSAFPDLSVDNIVTALTSSATFSTAPNNVHGYGRMDVDAAFNYLLQTNVPRPPAVSIQTLSGGFQLTWGASPTTSVTYTVYRDGVALTSGLSLTNYLDGGVLSSTSSSYSYSVSASVGPITSQPTKGMLGNIYQGNGLTIDRIDGFDLAYLIDLIGTTSSDLNWDAAADLNGDGVIDNADLAILTTHFGQVMK